MQPFKGHSALRDAGRGAHPTVCQRRVNKRHQSKSVYRDLFHRDSVLRGLTRFCATRTFRRGICATSAFRRGICATRACGRGICAARACRRGICATRAFQRGICARKAPRRGSQATRAFRRGFCATRAFRRGICATRACRRGFCATTTQSLQDGSFQSQGLGLRVIMCLQCRGGASPRCVEGRHAAFVWVSHPHRPNLHLLWVLGFLKESPRDGSICHSKIPVSNWNVHSKFSIVPIETFGSTTLNLKKGHSKLCQTHSKPWEHHAKRLERPL